MVTQLSEPELRMLVDLLEELCAALPGAGCEDLRARTRAVLNVFSDLEDD